MNEQYQEMCVAMLKVDLGITTNAYEDRLNSIVIAAVQAITAEGVSTFDQTDALDRQLVVMYASWLWSKRRTGEGMPKMLRYALNNRVFSEKMAGEANG